MAVRKHRESFNALRSQTQSSTMMVMRLRSYDIILAFSECRVSAEFDVCECSRMQEITAVVIWVFCLRTGIITPSSTPPTPAPRDGMSEEVWNFKKCRSVKSHIHLRWCATSINKPVITAI